LPVDWAVVSRRVRLILGWNRHDLRELGLYFSYKERALYGALYRRLREEGASPRWIELLRARPLPLREPILRRIAGFRRFPESARYAREILSERETLRTILARTELLSVAGPPGPELLGRAVELKEGERDFLYELARRLRELIPERPEWADRVEELWHRVVRRIRELRELFPKPGSLEGHVLDAVTSRPIRGAVVEIPVLGLRGVADEYGYYRIDGIPEGTYHAVCYAEGYEAETAWVVVEAGRVTVRDWRLRPVVRPLFRVLQSRMFYRNFKAKMTPDPFAFVVVWAKTREPEDPLYSEESFREALDYLVTDPECFPTLGMAMTAVGEQWLRRGKFVEFPASSYTVDGRDSRRIDEDELAEEARKLGVKPEELEDQVRYYVAFYRIRNNVPYIYREYFGSLTYEAGRWVIHPDYPLTKVEPGEHTFPELAPTSPEELEV